MKLKKYYADNMQEALRIIKDDIGPDAVILSSKFIRTKKGFFGLFSKKRIEVVAGFEEKPKPAETGFKPFLQNTQEVPVVSAQNSQPEQAAQAQNDPINEQGEAILNAYGQVIGRKSASGIKPQVSGNTQPIAPVIVQTEVINTEKEDLAKKEEEILQKEEALDNKIGELKSLINNLTNRVENYGNAPANAAKFSIEVRELYNKLLEQDIESGVAEELCIRTENISSSRQAPPKEVLSVFMSDMLGEVKPIQCTKFKRKVIMIIGPTGVGKTTTLVKLASKFLCEDNLNVGVINADVFRVAAKEHLKAYCDILNMDLVTIYSPEEIEEALEAFKEKDIVFIDTAGKLSSNKEYQQEIKELVELGNVDDIYLLVSASTSEKVIKSIVANYSFLRTHNIIVTKVDETPTKGVLFNIARDSGRPLSYITTGQSVPDDIALIDSKEVIESILESQA